VPSISAPKATMAKKKKQRNGVIIPKKRATGDRKSSRRARTLNLDTQWHN
jgi:hypothetical protein